MTGRKMKVGSGRAHALAQKGRAKRKVTKRSNSVPAGMGRWARTRTLASGTRDNRWRVTSLDWNDLVAKNVGLIDWLAQNSRERQSDCKGEAECAYCKEKRPYESMVNCDYCASNWDASCLRKMNQPVPLERLIPTHASNMPTGQRLFDV